MILKAIDTLEFGLIVEDYQSTFSSYLEEFEELKKAAQESMNIQTITIGSLVLTVERTGIPFYTYKLTSKDFSIYFMKTEMNSNPPIVIKFFSEYLWSYGCKHAYQNFLDWFSNFDATLLTNKLSRTDICVDTDEVTFKQIDSKGVVSRARKKEERFVPSEFSEGREFSGLKIGARGGLHCRIYNKLIELTVSGKSWFKQIWLDNGWAESKVVWRVEFEIRRQVLKQFSINTIEELLQKEDRLWAYLTGDWLSIRQPSKDNVSRWKVKRKWKIIENAGLNYQPSPIVREVIKQGNLLQLLNQTAGLMLSVAALSKHDTIEDTSKVIQSWVEVKLSHKNSTFNQEMHLRRDRYLLPNQNKIGEMENEQ
ncbi:replication initiation factor [Brevibacillus laterosporus]|uniref:replication initiation factor n=1 Tax=Brevibacillus laterosporus TaxID=1465 RepID=UPI000C7596AB|nr:replication initiation factor [Brevibacillus laterosporus]AUM63544.1 replication initiation factor [Brevibacillus laterosporus]